MFNYNLLWNDKEVVVEFEASGMNSVIDAFKLTGHSIAVSVLRKRVNFNVTPMELMNTLTSFPSVKIVSSVEPGDETPSDESSDEEEGQDGNMQGFRYSWSLDNQTHGEAVPASSDSEETDEERVGD